MNLCMRMCICPSVCMCVYMSVRVHIYNATYIATIKSLCKLYFAIAAHLHT